MWETAHHAPKKWADGKMMIGPQKKDSKGGRSIRHFLQV